MSAPGALKTARPDPLLEEVPLPLQADFYPLGFHLELASNSRDVLEAAQEAWGMYSREFACEAIRLRAVVQPSGALAPEPVFRGQGNLFTAVADRDNFAALSGATFEGFCFVSDATAANHAWFRWTFLESIVYLLLSQRYLVPVHAACVANSGRGVLLCGPSGAGKSTLAYACARAGWTFVCDDVTLLRAGSADRTAIGKPHQARFREDAPGLFPELSRYSLKIRPNGRQAIEIPIAAFPNIRTASRCRIEHVIFLDRRKPGVENKAHLRAMVRTAAIETLLSDLPVYTPDVNSLHEGTLRQLERVPSWRLTYGRLEDALKLLSELVSA